MYITKGTIKLSVLVATCCGLLTLGVSYVPLALGSYTWVLVSVTEGVIIGPSAGLFIIAFTLPRIRPLVSQSFIHLHADIFRGNNKIYLIFIRQWYCAGSWCDSLPLTRIGFFCIPCWWPDDARIIHILINENFLLRLAVAPKFPLWR